MTTLQLAVFGSSALLWALVLFQLALVFGAPWGEYAFGGRNKGKLPAGARVGSAISVLVYLAVVGHYYAQVQVLPQLLSPVFNNLANWAIVLVFAQATIMNLITRSTKERALWAPVATFLLIGSFVVALTPTT